MLVCASCPTPEPCQSLMFTVSDRPSSVPALLYLPNSATVRLFPALHPSQMMAVKEGYKGAGITAPSRQLQSMLLPATLAHLLVPSFTKAVFRERVPTRSQPLDCEMT